MFGHDFFLLVLFLSATGCSHFSLTLYSVKRPDSKFHRASTNELTDVVSVNASTFPALNGRMAEVILLNAARATAHSVPAQMDYLYKCVLHGPECEGWPTAKYTLTSVEAGGHVTAGVSVPKNNFKVLNKF